LLPLLLELLEPRLQARAAVFDIRNWNINISNFDVR